MNKYFHYAVLSALLCCAVAAEQLIKMEWNVGINNIAGLSANPSPTFANNTYYFISHSNVEQNNGYLVPKVYAIDTARKELLWSGFPYAFALHSFPQYDMLVVIGDTYVSGVRASTSGTVVWSHKKTTRCKSSPYYGLPLSAAYMGTMLLSLQSPHGTHCILAWLDVATGKLKHRADVGALQGVSGNTVVSVNYHYYDLPSHHYYSIYGSDAATGVTKWKLIANDVLGTANGKTMLYNESHTTSGHDIVLVNTRDGTTTKVIPGLFPSYIPSLYVQHRNSAEAYLFNGRRIAKIDLNSDVVVWKQSVFGNISHDHAINYLFITGVVKCGSSVIVSVTTFGGRLIIVALDDRDGRMMWKVNYSPTVPNFVVKCLGSSVFVPNMMGYIAYSPASGKVVARNIDGTTVYGLTLVMTSADRFVTQQMDGSVSGCLIV